MNIAKKFVLLMAFATLSTTPAYADGRYDHGGGHGGSGGWWIIPALIGGAFVYELTRPPEYFPPEPVYVTPSPLLSAPSSPPAYAPGDVPAQGQNWYFCAASNGYYPYVRSCPNGWETVPVNPPDAMPDAQHTRSHPLP